MKLVHEMMGHGELLQVYEDYLVITPKGFWGFVRSKKGAKTIPFGSISGILFKEAGLLSGCLEFSIPGAKESRGTFDMSNEMNTFTFASGSAKALEIKKYIDDRVRALATPNSASSPGIAEQIRKLADLRQQGLLSDDEFASAKARILS